MGSCVEFRYPVGGFALQSLIEADDDVEVSVRQPIGERPNRSLEIRPTGRPA